jgi:hypothetical protein
MTSVIHMIHQPAADYACPALTLYILSSPHGVSTSVYILHGSRSTRLALCCTEYDVGQSRE